MGGPTPSKTTETKRTEQSKDAPPHQTKMRNTGPKHREGTHAQTKLDPPSRTSGHPKPIGEPGGRTPPPARGKFSNASHFGVSGGSPHPLSSPSGFGQKNSRQQKSQNTEGKPTHQTNLILKRKHYYRKNSGEPPPRQRQIFERITH